MGKKQRQRRGGSGGPGGGGGSPVYGLGLIGAAVWYWHQADDPRGRAIGVLKAFAWPGFLVYDAFKALEGQGPR